MEDIIYCKFYHSFIIAKDLCTSYFNIISQYFHRARKSSIIIFIASCIIIFYNKMKKKKKKEYQIFESISKFNRKLKTSIQGQGFHWPVCYKLSWFSSSFMSGRLMKVHCRVGRTKHVCINRCEDQFIVPVVRRGIQ